MSGQADVTIAGAGALGLASAVSLADAGFRVTVCDPALSNASAVAAGMIAPASEAVLDAAARPHVDVLFAARDLWPALADRTGIALHRDGAMAVGDEAWLASVAQSFAALDLHPTELSGATARALAPGLADGWSRALLTREDWRVDANQALAALRAAADEAGVVFRREAVGARERAGLLVVATGAGADPLAPELSCLTPIKGHILRVQAPWAARLTVRGPGAYAAPGGEGVMTVGATMEAGIADAAVDPAKAAPLLGAAARLFPALAGAPYDLAAGVRAATSDGLPMVGFGAEPDVILAVGARRNGWLLAPLVARLVAACATGADPGAYGRTLAPTRFDGGNA